MIEGPQYLKILIITLVMFVFAACSGGGDDDGDVIGTGAKSHIVSGTAATGLPIANATVHVKGVKGVRGMGSTGADGKFNVSFSDVPGTSLIKVERNDGPDLFSIFSSEGEGNNGQNIEKTVNIHPFTDLIVRNWFAVQGLDIETEFASNSAIAMLPTATDIENIRKAINDLLKLALLEYSLPADFDWIGTIFDANQTGFDGFLDGSLVAIINNNFTITVTDSTTSIENAIANNVALNTDLTLTDNTPPSTPGNLRAVPASGTEMIVVWDPSTDNIGVAGYNVYLNGVLKATTPYPVFSDSGLTTGVNYCYEVEALDGAGNTSARAMTTPVCTQTIGSADNTPPDAPTALAALPLGSSSIALAWSQTGVNDVVGFKIYRGSISSIDTLVATVTSTTYVDFNLVSSTEYCYEVLAYDAAGNESARSTPAACATTEVGSDLPSGASKVTFSEAAYSVTEADATAAITVNRVGDMVEAISVDYDIASGTATAGMDFVATSGTLTWGANDNTPRIIYVQIKGDVNAEGSETVALSLSNPSVNTSLGDNADATLTISNSDCAGVLSADVIVDTTITTCTLVTASIDITNGATLTIAPGVTLLFQSNTGFNVNNDGALIAVGSIPSPILFTGTSPTPGFWRGIQFTNSNNINNELDYVTLEYGGSGYNGTANVVLFGNTTPPRLKISNTVLSDSIGYGFEFNEGSSIGAFDNVTSTRNTTGPGLLHAEQLSKLDGNSDYSGNTIDRVYVQNIGGNRVLTDQTWPAINVPYYMGTTYVDANLVIEAGAQLVFRAGGQLNVTDTGSLKAVGTAGNKILFTGDQPTRGYWKGVQYTSSNNVNNVLDHVIIEYGGDTGNGDANLVMFGVTANRIQVTNSEFRESLGYGIELDIGTIVSGFSGNVITNNQLSPVRLPADSVRYLGVTSTYTGNDDDTIYVENDAVDTDQTWESIGVPYLVGSHAINGHLTIAPGNTLIFRGGGRFNVDQFGALTADGTISLPIVFTGESASPGFWNGIQFTFTNNVNNILNFVTVEYAGAPINGEGNVMLFGSALNPSDATITNSTLRNSSSYGLWLNADSTVTSSNNTFSNNALGDVFGP